MSPPETPLSDGPPPPGRRTARARAAAADDVRRTLEQLRHQLAHVQKVIDEDVVGPAATAASRSKDDAERGEERWPVLLAVLVAIALQIALPERLALGPRWLIPALEGTLLVALGIANPRRVNRRSTALRTASVALVALTSLANAYASFELVRDIVSGREHVTATALLSSGGAIYLTNIIVFGLWYWEWDRGGPAARARGERPYPDFLFPQLVSPEVTPSGWSPTFIDYLYTSYTNATAFSPTDTMPLSRWSKLLMLLQSAVALVTIGLVVARAVNILQ